MDRESELAKNEIDKYLRAHTAATMEQMDHDLKMQSKRYGRMWEHRKRNGINYQDELDKRHSEMEKELQSLVIDTLKNGTINGTVLKKKIQARNLETPLNKYHGKSVYRLVDDIVAWFPELGYIKESLYRGEHTMIPSATSAGGVAYVSRKSPKL